MKKRFFVATALFFLALSASGAEINGLVKGFYVDSNGIVLLKLVVNPANPPQCKDGGVATWDYSFSLSDASAKQWMNMLLIARATGVPIAIGYIPTATNYCAVSYLYFLG